MTNNVSFGAFKPASANDIKKMGNALRTLRKRTTENKNSFLKAYIEAKEQGNSTTAVCEKHLYSDSLIKRAFAIERNNIVRGQTTLVLREGNFSAFSLATKKLGKILKRQNDPNTLQVAKLDAAFDGRKTNFDFMSKASEILFRSDLDPRNEKIIANYINAIRKSADEAFTPSLIVKVKKFFGFN